MKYPIIVLLTGITFFAGSFILKERGNQLLNDSLWGKVPEENLTKAQLEIEISEYLFDIGNYITVGGEVWLALALVGKVKNKI